MRLKLFLALLTLLQAANGPSPRVGPARGTVLAVGGGISPGVLAKFIELAGGPDALIIDVPTAGQDQQMAQPGFAESTTAKWRAAGAKNVVVLHTRDRKIADSDSFIEPIRRAGGVWFGGGLTEQIAQSYAGTKAEQEFRNVLERGGAVGGTSAGAVVLGKTFTNGLQQNFTNLAMTDGFNILRDVVFDPHAGVPRPANFLARYPGLLGIAANEPTAWLVRGDEAEIIGTGTAFVYRDDPNRPGSGYIALYPGDRYNLATHAIRRAIEGSPLTEPFIDSLFVDFATPGGPAAAVGIAHDGKVLVHKSYNIPSSAQNVPTTRSNFALGDVADSFNGIAVQVLAHEGKLSLDDPVLGGNLLTIRQYLQQPADLPNGRSALAQLIDKAAGMPAGPLGLGGARSQHEAFLRRILGGGASLIDPNRIVGEADTGEFVGNLDYLYDWDSRLTHPYVFATSQPDTTLGWRKDTYRGVTRLSLFATKDGKRNAFVRIPEKRITVMILTNKDDTDARAIAERITDRLVEAPR